MKGILMIEPLYHQVIAGNKTQTRRSGGLEWVNENPDEWDTPVWVEERISRSRTLSLVEFMRPSDRSIVIQCSPRYKKGEVLYIKEPYNKELIYHDPDNDDSKYRYSYQFGKQPHIRTLLKWKNKMFMPACAARAFIKITGIRCERLLDISDEDCVAEGIEKSGYGDAYINYLMHTGYGYDYVDNDPRTSFFSLYKFANKLAKVGSVPPHGSLPTPPGVYNIWVWAYEFEYLNVSAAPIVSLDKVC